LERRGERRAALQERRKALVVHGSVEKRHGVDDTPEHARSDPELEFGIERVIGDGALVIGSNESMLRIDFASHHRSFVVGAKQGDHDERERRARSF